MSHGTHMIEARHAYETVISHAQIRLFTHVDD